jgi:tripartite-type tricarboxylate transporter receptor subunit TctC
MHNRILDLVVLTFLFVAFGIYSAPSSAQDGYPDRPIKLVVPWPAGAGTDVVQRLAAKVASAELHRNFVVTNKPGAAGVIGALEVEKALPDGYVLGGIASTVLLTQYTSTNPTDWNNYAPIATLTYDAAAIAVRADSRWKNLTDFLAYAKSHPGEVKVGHSGIGGFHHLFAAMLEEAAGVKFQFIPYKGGSESALATISGDIDATSADTSALFPLSSAGSLRVLGLAGEHRQSDFPGVPTYQEQGVDLKIGVRRLVVAPKGTPSEIINKLERAYLNAGKNPEFTNVHAGWQIDLKNASDTTKAMAQDDQKIRKAVDELGLRAKR